METIKTYVDNMFKSIPNTERSQSIKDDLLSTMEDKYNELKAEGKSENEAVGVVISEFGSIDELTGELGTVKPISTEPQQQVFVSHDEADKYISDTKKFSRTLAAGVAMCILAPAATLTASAFGELRNQGLFESLGLLLLFVFIAIGVSLIIFSAISLDCHDRLEKQLLALDFATEKELRESSAAYTPYFATYIALGVALCILAPFVMMILMDVLLGGASVAIMLAMIAVAVYLFIVAGMKRDAFDTLLQTGDHTKQRKTRKTPPAVRVVNSLIWPLTVIAFLAWGFLFDGWGISWILFPISGVLTALVNGVSNAITGSDEDD